jgi:hypothetical protein
MSSSLLDLYWMIKRKRSLPQVPFGRILFMGAWRIERKSASLRAVIDPFATLTCSPH